MTAAAARVRLLLQSTAFQLCEYLYRIHHDTSPNQWNVIFESMLMKTKGSHRWLTFGKRVHKMCLSESAQSPYKSILRNMAWQDSHMHMLSLHERLVKGWGMCKVWCVILYLICALGNGMEARFHHWLKKKCYCDFLSHNSVKKVSKSKVNKLFHIIQWRKRAVSMLIKH